MAKANDRPGVFGVLKRSVREFLDDDCMMRAAALSYYTVFSLPPLLILILMLAGTLLDPADIRGGIERQIDSLMGPAGGEQVRAMLTHAERPGGGLLPTLVGIGAILFGATGAFVQLQGALNRAWEVEPDPTQGGIKNFVLKRVMSFGMILTIAFLLLVSLMVSAALTAFGGALESYLPAGVSASVLQVVNQALSLGVIALLFAMMFKVVPDATIAWRDVWVGAGLTAVLFTAGKFLIGLYIGKSNPGEAYGAAGSLALLLLWIYYSSLILLFGAEFTQAWAERRGRGGIAAEPGARRLING
ncbi:MAG TPA: YihY/virulence factor BrkB family protein [Gemmatimonadales bacterium]|nr:YihY/virulence factor BrkB family protein [Gemmatimonadales bacterium]